MILGISLLDTPKGMLTPIQVSTRLEVARTKKRLKLALLPLFYGIQKETRGRANIAVGTDT